MRLSQLLNYAQGVRRNRTEMYESLSRRMWRDKARYMNLIIPRPRPEVAAKLEQYNPEDMFESDRYEREILAATTPGQMDWSPPDFSSWVWKNPRQRDSPGLLFNWRRRWEHPEAQASALTSTIISRQLPTSIAAQIPDLAAALTEADTEALQRAVMHAHRWHSDEIKLPKRFNVERPEIKMRAEFGIPPDRIVRHLMANLLRLAALRHPGCDRHLLRDSLLETAFYWRGVPVHLQERRPFHLIGRRPLATLADTAAIEASQSAVLPSLYPLSPLIDLEESSQYDTSVSSTGLDDPESVNRLGGHCHLAVIPLELPNMWCNFNAPEERPVTHEHRIAAGVVGCFGQAVAQARVAFGPGVEGRRLPLPIVTLGVCTDGVYFDFVCYQLNTLELGGPDPAGVKNLAWVDAGNRLVDKRVPMDQKICTAAYEDLDAGVYAKLLALYRYGLP